MKLRNSYTVGKGENGDSVTTKQAWGACTTTQGHGDVRPRLPPRATSGSVVRPESVLMLMTRAVIKGYGDFPDLGYCLRPCWYLSIVLSCPHPLSLAGELAFPSSAVAKRERDTLCFLTAHPHYLQQAGGLASGSWDLATSHWLQHLGWVDPNLLTAK